MTPTPQTSFASTETKLHLRSCSLTPEDDIVISGMSGKFPNSGNIDELSYNLYNKIDMVDDAEKRWRHVNPEIPRRMGKIEKLDKFDAKFFGVNYKLGHAIDPQCRILVETAYEAIIDAGINPNVLKGTKTGVYIGSLFSDSDKVWYYERTRCNGYGILGCIRSMLANRISTLMELNGPSVLIDTACSSSMTAIDAAFNAMRNDEIDTAIVGGSNLITHPFLTLQFTRLGVLAKNGISRPFDIDACGYTRSEAICVLLLQKAKNAKRIYSTLLYSKINSDGYKTEGITYPSGAIQEKLLTEFYEDININPSIINYVEAHSTGTIVGDPEECQSLENVYCKQRTQSLPIGSIKSNIGHTEATCGVCSIVKAHLAFETQFIAPNINFTHGRPGIQPLETGTLKVCSEITRLDGPLVAINSFGFGGANAHILLKQHSKIKENNGLPRDDVPRLIFWTGRTEQSVHTIFNDIQTRTLDTEYFALVNSIHTEKIAGNNFRGYAIYEQKNETNAVELCRNIEYYNDAKCPMIWIFGGVATEWIEMSKDFFELSIFRQTIQYCHDLLMSFEINLINIITSKNSEVISNNLDGVLTAVSIQLCFIEILRQLNIKPNYIIGYSIGELVCAYADGMTTIAETILAAYILITTILNISQTVVVGITKNYLQKILPSTINIIHYNNENGTTIINGPENDVTQFIMNLEERNVFVLDNFTRVELEEFNMLNFINRIFCKETNASKWVVQSYISYDDVNQNNNNRNISLKLFEENCQKLPKKSLIIEISPFNIFQETLNHWFPNGHYFPLLNKQHKNNLISLLITLGDLFVFGLDILISNLYPIITFPVSRGTRIISPLIKWDHSQEWYVPGFNVSRTCISTERKVTINLNDQEYEYISGHVLDGKCLFPATAYLQLIWETFALIEGTIFFDMDIEYKDIRFLHATSLTNGQPIELTIRNHIATGHFEIAEGTTEIVTGIIKKITKHTSITKLPTLPPTNFPMLTGRDFYKELRLRGCQYNGGFRAVQAARGDGLYSQIKWESNWVTFMDCLLQVSMLVKDSRQLAVPTRIERLKINTKEHMLHTTENLIFDVNCNKALKTLVSGGIEMCGIIMNPISRRIAPGHPVLESYQFIPYLPTPKLDTTNAARMCVQIALENFHTLKVNVVEMNLNGREQIIQYFSDALDDLPLVTSELSLISDVNNELTSNKINVVNRKLADFTNLTFIISSEFEQQQDISLHDCGYLVIRSDTDSNWTAIPTTFQLICEIPMESEKFYLFQKTKLRNSITPAIINIDDENYVWIKKYNNITKDKPVILYSQQDKCSGIIGLVNCIRREPNGKQTACFFMDDVTAPLFNIDNIFYQNQLKLGLAINVYRNGKWGSYRHFQLKTCAEPKQSNDHCYANILQKGDLSTICWLQGPINDVNKQEKIVNIQYTALNFRDVMLGTGRISVDLLGQDRVNDEYFLGFEFAGIDKKQQKVMGMVQSGALSTHIIPSDVLTWEVPNNWSLQDAVTCPTIYLTVYVAFFKYTKISKGKSILIHAGSGGVGLAAIRVALAYGMNVYTTVSNNIKKKFIMEQFPRLKESQIGNSRNCSFEQMIKIGTNGKGVDYVLNSLSDDKLRASIRCLGRGGTIFEIGKFDQSNDTKISLYPFLKTVSIRGVHVDKLFSRQSEDGRYFKELIDKDLKSGIIQPITSTVFNTNEIENSFRYLSTGKHVGKVIIKIRDDPSGKSNLMRVLPRAYFDPNLVYIIAGGLGGFGLELADWLVIRGARKIILSSKRGLTKMYQSYRIRIWESYSCKVIVDTADITNYQGCYNLIHTAMKIGPIGGIFNLAVILKDDLMENQTVESFVESLAPKAIATKYLDELSRELCPELKYFVIFSSISCGRGNAGQPNYGMANSIMERIIEQRTQSGFSGKAIQWGAIGEVGLVADMAEDKIDIEIGGTLQQRISSCLYEMDTLLLTPDPVVSCMVVAEKRSGSDSENLIDSILNIIGIRDIKSISMATTLSELGMDSLMTSEIKQTLERKFEICLSPQDLRNLTFGKLKEFSGVHGKNSLTAKTKIDCEISNTKEIFTLIKSLGNEVNGCDTLLRLTTLSSNQEFNSCILILPGIEGVVNSAWHSLATNIKLPSYFMQLNNSDGKGNIMDITKTFGQFALDVFAEKKYFHLIGYSFGSIITLEIAKLLENVGMKGNVLLIDGSPVWIKDLLSSQLNTIESTDKNIEIMLMFGIIKNIFTTELQDNVIIMKLSECDSLDERVSIFLDIIKSQLNYSETYIRIITNAIIDRVKYALNIDTENVVKIKSSIILVRPTEISLTNIQEDYELSRYTENSVNVKFIEGNHSSILENNILVDIINDCFANQS